MCMSYVCVFVCLCVFVLGDMEAVRVIFGLGELYGFSNDDIQEGTAHYTHARV